LSEFGARAARQTVTPANHVGPELALDELPRRGGPRPDEAALSVGCAVGARAIEAVSFAGNVRGGHENRVDTVAFSPECRWVLTGSEDTTAPLWAVKAFPALPEAWPQAGPEGNAARHSVHQEGH
jgi:hypothetical protein